VDSSLDAETSKYKEEERCTNECTTQIVEVEEPKQSQEVMHDFLTIVVDEEK
jgi:hypothetical protein